MPGGDLLWRRGSYTRARPLAGFFFRRCAGAEVGSFWCWVGLRSGFFEGRCVLLWLEYAGEVPLFVCTSGVWLSLQVEVENR